MGSTDAGRAWAGADAPRTATFERAGGADSGRATDPSGPSGNVAATVSRATTDQHAGGGTWGQNKTPITEKNPYPSWALGNGSLAIHPGTEKSRNLTSKAEPLGT